MGNLNNTDILKFEKVNLLPKKKNSDLDLIQDLEKILDRYSCYPIGEIQIPSAFESDKDIRKFLRQTYRLISDEYENVYEAKGYLQIGDYAISNLYREVTDLINAKGVMEKTDSEYRDIKAVKKNKFFVFVLYPHINKERAIAYLKAEGYSMDLSDLLYIYARDWMEDEPDRIKAIIKPKSKIPKKYSQLEKIGSMDGYKFIIYYPDEKQTFIIGEDILEKDHYEYSDDYFESKEVSSISVVNYTTNQGLIDLLNEEDQRVENILEDYADFIYHSDFNEDQLKLVHNLKDKLNDRDFDFNKMEFSYLRKIVEFMESYWETF